MKQITTWIFVIIWLFNLIVGVGAGYAALRFWHSRHQPLIREMGLFILSAVVDAAGAVALLFAARGVRLTWKFSIVLFASAFFSNLLRIPLIVLTIRGPEQPKDTPPLLEPPLSKAMTDRFDRLEDLIVNKGKVEDDDLGRLPEKTSEDANG